MSLFTYNNAIDDVVKDEKNNKLPKNESDNYAKHIMTIQEVRGGVHDHDVNHNDNSDQYHPVLSSEPPRQQSHNELPNLQQPQQQYQVQVQPTQYAPVQQPPQNKEPVIATQALTQASVMPQQTQPVPVGGGAKTSCKLQGSDISKVGTYSVKSLDTFDNLDNMAEDDGFSYL